MQWVVTAVWSIAHANLTQLATAADDLDGDMHQYIVAGRVSVRFELIAATRGEAIAIAEDLIGALSLPQPIEAISAQSYRQGLLVASGRHDVEALTPEMRGTWLVKTQGSEHLWDLDCMTYTRKPGSRSLSGAFTFDHRAVLITRVERWPRVGSTSLLWFDDPSNGEQAEHWRQSSGIVSITEI